MVAERRLALDDVIQSMRAGRMTRRTFVRRALALGLSASAAGSLLEACGGRGTTYIVWESEHDPNDTYRPIVDAFNQHNTANIHVTYRNGPPDPNELHGDQQAMLSAQSGSTDILSMDATWPAEYAAKGWLLPLDLRWSVSARTAFLTEPQQEGWLADHLWAAPYNVDVGAIYYRTDLVAQPPQTWDELAAQAAELAAQKKLPAGFVWPGTQTEGLVCLFAEVLAGYGGAVFSPNDPYTVTLDTPEAHAALDQMISWLGSASPLAVTTYNDDQARQQWQHGNAVFMRNWLTAYPAPKDGNAANVQGKIGVAPLPGGSNGGPGHGCLGGWHIGINANSGTPDAAWEFIAYLLAPQRLLGVARTAGLPVSLTAAYDDPTILAHQPNLARLRSLLTTARPRPISPIYSTITAALQSRIHQALLGQLTADEALAALQTHLQALSTQAIPVPPDVPFVTPAPK
jgi:multiple sugar transport system substrate-binding protein